MHKLNKKHVILIAQNVMGKLFLVPNARMGIMLILIKHVKNVYMQIQKLYLILKIIQYFVWIVHQIFLLHNLILL